MLQIIYTNIKFQNILYVLILFLYVKSASCENLNIAVASNFFNVAKVIADKYEKNTGKKINIVSGSTAQLYNQILFGAPYDIFFSGKQSSEYRNELINFIKNQNLNFYGGVEKAFNDYNCNIYIS